MQRRDGSKRRQHGHLIYNTETGPTRADMLARRVVGSPRIAPKIEKYRRSLVGLHTIKRIIHNKCLHGLILQWIIEAFYRLSPVLELPQDPYSEKHRDEMVENLILKTGEADEENRWVAKPIMRLTEEQRRQFEEDLDCSLDNLVAAVVADDDSFNTYAEKLSPTLRQLAEELRANEEKSGMLRELDRGGRDFRNSTRDLLKGVLLPVLFKSPVVGIDDFLDLWVENIKSLYLLVIMLNDQTIIEIKDIAREREIVELFENSHSQLGKKSPEQEMVIAKILERVVDVFAKEELFRRLMEGLRTLEEIDSLIRATNTMLPDLAFRSARNESTTTAETTRASVRNILLGGVEEQIRGGIKTYQATATATADPSTATADAGGNGKDQSTGARNLFREEIHDFIREAGEGKTPPTTEAEVEELVASVEQRLADSVDRKLLAYSRLLNLIYEKYYTEAKNLPLRRRTEQTALAQIMLEDREVLGFGENGSNLFHMLLDVVTHIDDSLDPAEFLRKVTITKYFDNLDDGGITDLRKTLDIQGWQSLNEMASFVSEQRSICLALEAAASSGGRVVVFDGDANQFLARMQADAFGGPGVLGPGSLVRVDGASGTSSLRPDLVVLTASALRNQLKADWLEGVADLPLHKDGHPLVLPPMVLSVGRRDAEESWADEGENLNNILSRIPAPVTIVGPDIEMNPADDPFPTTFDAAVLFGCEWLGGGAWGLNHWDAPDRSRERFRVLGYGKASLSQSIRRSIRPAGPESDYALVVDQYLYHILLLAAAGKYHGGAHAFDVTGFLRSCHLPPDSIGRYDESAGMLELLRHASEKGLALGEDVNSRSLSRVLVATDPRMPLINRAAPYAEVRCIEWFNLAIKALQLVDFQSSESQD